MLGPKLPFGCRGITDAEWQAIHLSCWDMLGEPTNDDDHYVIVSGYKIVFGVGCCPSSADEPWKPLCCLGNYFISVEDKMIRYETRRDVLDSFDRKWYLDRAVVSERQLMDIIKVVYKVDGRSGEEILLRVRDALLRYVECTQLLLNDIPMSRIWFRTNGRPLKDDLARIYHLACGKSAGLFVDDHPSNYSLLCDEVMRLVYGEPI